jgi:hypothetical protein
MHNLAHSRLRDSQPLRRGDLGLAATPDVARDLQRQIAAQRLDRAGIVISGNSVFTITLVTTLFQCVPKSNAQQFANRADFRNMSGNPLCLNNLLGRQILPGLKQWSATASPAVN